MCVYIYIYESLTCTGRVVHICAYMCELCGIKKNNIYVFPWLRFKRL